MKRLVILGILSVTAISWLSNSAEGLAPFKKAFQQKYVDESGNDDLKAAFKKASCNTCHIKGKKKEERNAYGDELEKLIEGDANARLKEAGKDGRDARKAEQEKLLVELEEAFKKVESMKEGDAEQTFGDRIKAGMLPVPLPE